MKTCRKILNIIGWLSLFAMVVYVILIWNTLPHQIPSHYNFQGEIDQYGGKATILIMPITMTLLFLLLVVVERFPNSWNIPVEICEDNKERVYESMRLMLVGMRAMFMINAFLTTYAMSHALQLPSLYLPIFIGIVFLLLVINMIYIVKINKKRKE